MLMNNTTAYFSKVSSKIIQYITILYEGLVSLKKKKNE